MHVMKPKAMKQFLMNSDEILQAMKDIAHKSVTEKITVDKAFKIQQ